MEVATSVLNCPPRNSDSTAFCSFCFMPAPPALLPPPPCPMNILQREGMTPAMLKQSSKPWKGGDGQAQLINLP